MVQNPESKVTLGGRPVETTMLLSFVAGEKQEGRRSPEEEDEFPQAKRIVEDYAEVFAPFN